MKAYETKLTTYNHQGAKVNIEYSIDGDSDYGILIIINKITDMCGNDVDETENDDFAFECREHYGNMQTEAYMKHGDII